MADERPECEKCGGPCRLEAWARDGSYFANNPSAYSAAIARRHSWFDASRAIEVDRIRAETRAMVFVPTFPCVVCQKFAFDRDGVTCYWCGRRKEEVLIHPAIEAPPDLVEAILEAREIMERQDRKRARKEPPPPPSLTLW